MTLTELYNIGKKIPEYLKYENKYTWLGFKKIIDIRYLDANDIFNIKTPVNNFINQYGEVLLIPNIINGKVVDLLIKSLKTNQMLNYKEINLPYNIGQLNNFKYGDYLFIVEGPADVAGLKLIDPSLPVVALKTNDINKESYQIYESLTNNIVLILDNDKAGKKQLLNIRLKLKDLGISTYVIPQYGKLKDTGDIVKLAMLYEKNANSEILIELGNINLYYKSQIKLIKVT
jgi:hypothetical protein